MSSKLAQITAAITVEIQKISGIGATGTQEQGWMEETNLPAAYTIFGYEDKALAPTRSKEARARFIIATIVRSSTPLETFQQLYADIETQIEDDPSLGGLTLEAYIAGAGSFATSKGISGPLHLRDVFIDVVYRHARGVP